MLKGLLEYDEEVRGLGWCESKLDSARRVRDMGPWYPPVINYSCLGPGLVPPKPVGGRVTGQSARVNCAEWQNL